MMQGFGIAKLAMDSHQLEAQVLACGILHQTGFQQGLCLIEAAVGDEDVRLADRSRFRLGERLETARTPARRHIGIFRRG